jgi:hypothetical protein
MGIPVKELVTSDVVMGSFMLKDGVLNDAEHAISFDLKPSAVRTHWFSRRVPVLR